MRNANKAYGAGKNLEELLDMEQFMREAEEDYQVKVDLGGLRFHSSPRMRLLPLPVYKNGHKAHYPRKNLRRVATIKVLQYPFGFDLSDIKKILGVFPEDKLHLIYKRILLKPDLDRILEWFENGIINHQNAEYLLNNLSDARQKDRLIADVRDKIMSSFNKFFEDEEVYIEPVVDRLLGRGDYKNKGEAGLNNMIAEIQKALVAELTKARNIVESNEFKEGIKNSSRAFVDNFGKKAMFKTMNEELNKLLSKILLK